MQVSMTVFSVKKTIKSMIGMRLFCPIDDKINGLNPWILWSKTTFCFQDFIGFEFHKKIIIITLKSNADLLKSQFRRLLKPSYLFASIWLDFKFIYSMNRNILFFLGVVGCFTLTHEPPEKKGENEIFR